MKHSKEEEETEPRPAQTLKEGNPEIVILRDLKILNPGVSINQRKRLPEMAKIGGSSLGTRRKGNVMECTWTIQPTSMMNGMKKKRVTDNPKKGQVPAYKGWWKLNWKQWKWKMSHSILTDTVCIVNWLWNISVWNNRNYWTPQPVKLEYQEQSHPSKWSQVIYYFICFPLFLITHMDQKAPGLANIYFNKEVFPIRRKLQSKLEKYSCTSPTGNYGWISSVICNYY